jgi:2-polyprenyl-3-methyl-5-hydroxy-6-metoxy-1,4-benzoquinol methylase
LQTKIEQRYIRKEDSWSSHSIFLKWLRDFPPGTKVLDIGTATGILGSGCSKSGFTLKGLEPVIEWAEMARPFYSDLLCSSLEQAPDEFIACQDVVICGDVLEHTSDPAPILKRLVKLQKTETEFFISVPNIANIWIRINLMLGKFNYTENGILDKTHLRFFTKSTFLDLLQSSGLRLVVMEVTPIPLTRLSLFFQNNGLGQFFHRGLASLTRLFPGLFAYQFVAHLKISAQEQVT